MFQHANKMPPSKLLLRFCAAFGWRRLRSRLHWKCWPLAFLVHLGHKEPSLTLGTSGFLGSGNLQKSTDWQEKMERPWCLVNLEILQGFHGCFGSIVRFVFCNQQFHTSKNHGKRSGPTFNPSPVLGNGVNMLIVGSVKYCLHVRNTLVLQESVMKLNCVVQQCSRAGKTQKTPIYT